MKLKNANHIIEKVLVEVNTSSVETAHSIKNNIDVFLKDELFPRLEMLFDDYHFRNEIIRFDEITIDLSLKKWDDFKGLKYDIYNQLKEKIDSRVNQGFKSENVKNNEFNFGEKEVQKVSTDFNTSHVFLFFLENGYLPWFGKKEQTDSFIEPATWGQALENENFVHKLNRLLVTNEFAIERFIIQFSDEIFLEYLIRNNSGIKKYVAGIQEVSNDLGNFEHLQFLKLMFRISLKEYEDWFEILTKLESSVLKAVGKVPESKKIRIIQKLREIVYKLIPGNVLNQQGITKNQEQIVERPFKKEVFEKFDNRNIFDKADKIGESDKIEETYLTNDEETDVNNIDSERTSNDKFDGRQILKEEIEATQHKKEKTIKDLSKNDDADKIETEDIPGLDKRSETNEFQLKKFKRKEGLPFLDKDKNEIWVKNAGLIVLHPFIKPFFITTGVCDKQGKFLSEDYDLPIQSLHYLATGVENFFEGNLVFEKFLCGVPIKMPVLQKSLLTDQIKSEATVLLNEVVKNWPALKNTSADGLRQMFIQRDGKLLQKEDSYKLIVERKAQDVLLEKLNWNISMVKLPWISKILFTEW